MTFLFRCLLCFSPVAFIGSASAAETSAEARSAQRAELREMDRAWARYQQHAPDMAVRDLFSFVLTAAERNWHPETIPEILDLAESMHDRDPASRTYGNYRWYWRDAKPDDRNAVEFSLQAASLTWVLYRDRLVPDARAKLAAALTLGAEGLLRHKVDVSYTNIFLMRLANSILIGESTDRPDLVEKGVAWFDEWFAYTRANGIHEFSSPTYTGVDLGDLGMLARHSRDPAIRAKAEAALRLFWTELSANWFEPHQGIAGATSRDYGFLTGHGYLDQYLQRAGWIATAGGNARPTLEDVTFVPPATDILPRVGELPREVRQRWGVHPWEQATHHVARHFALGTAGAGYGQQDRILTLAFDGGPKQTLGSFSLDYRNDPYGQAKVVTSGGHLKLTHLVPFVTSVQRGAETLLLAIVDPAAKGTPSDIAAVHSNFILPADVEIWEAEKCLTAANEASSQALDIGSVQFLRRGDVAVAVRFVVARDDHREPAGLRLERDGLAVGSQRLTVTNAPGKPQGPIMTAIWVRVAEGLDDVHFAQFRRDAIAANGKTKTHVTSDHVEVEVAGMADRLRLSVQPGTLERLIVEGADPALQTGILNVNGRDVGAACLP